ncbi:MAG TPA: hypothetical protein VNU68_25825 [Verrucomicrobiae bacterium]|nr:hypothetical protein [Verrucomicrobiae bacterium]
MTNEKQPNLDQIQHHVEQLHVEELEERIAPSVNGTGGYDGQPGNQCAAKNNPSGSANPEN